MKSILLGSILILSIVAPLVAARDPHPVRGARRLALFLVLFTAAYMAWAAFGHTRFFVPQR
jgi:hypothetical protein